MRRHITETCLPSCEEGLGRGVRYRAAVGWCRRASDLHPVLTCTFVRARSADLIMNRIMFLAAFLAIADAFQTGAPMTMQSRTSSVYMQTAETFVASPQALAKVRDAALYLSLSLPRLPCPTLSAATLSTPPPTHVCPSPLCSSPEPCLPLASLSSPLPTSPPRSLPAPPPP